MPPKTKYMFQIVFGDFSNDGHGMTETRVFHSLKPIEAVRDAFFAGRTKAPAPDTLCSEYEEDSVPAATVKRLKSLGAPVPKKTADTTWYPADIDWMARYTAWYLNLSDPELEVEEVKGPALPALHFYGHDPQGRHINFIGYGLFSRE